DILEWFYTRWCAQSDKLMQCNDNEEAIQNLQCYVNSQKHVEKTQRTSDGSRIKFLVSLTEQDYHFPGRFWPFQNPMISEVHSGYLECIKNGDNYLFITNQYFVGDDYAHHSPNRIPNALLNKIATSHAQNKPFHV